MSHDLTLDQITPRMTPRRMAVLVVMIVSALAVLAFSYVWIGINPIQLYEKRENAFEYLFGRRLTEADREEAWSRAERMPRIIAYQEALQAVKAELAARGGTEDFAVVQREAERRAEAMLASQSSEERDRVIREEYERILDEKRGGFFPPETHPNRLTAYSSALLETVAIAIWGTLAAVVAAVPVSLLAARNTLEVLFPGDSSVFRWLRASLQFTVRRVLDFCRGFNEFVMALVFVAVIGLGPFAGVLALAIHTFGILGKVFSESIEAVEPGQVEAVVAGGAGPLQVVSFAVLPQAMPLMVSYSLLRFESNVRSATILGFCGAGGIGFLMFDKLNGYQYREVATMMIMVIVSVTVIDHLCGKLRSRFI
jgi:phosphonate transport system permease protein